MAIDSRVVRRVAAASVIGATVEWYDFFLYGVVAGIVFDKQYFPAGDAFLPTYAQIGMWAPVLLLTLRVLQGIGPGGEWGGAVLI